MDAHRNDFVDWFGVSARMAFAHAYDPASISGESTIGVAITVTFGGLKRERGWRRGSSSQAIEPLIGPVHEYNVGTVQPPRSPAIFVHTSTSAEPFG